MMRKSLAPVLAVLVLSSCWGYRNNYPAQPGTKVWGYKPIYGSDTVAKKISYVPSPVPVVSEGNIYAFQNYIFQLDAGIGIHVIDNTVPASAHRIGFINIKSCSQISVKGGQLYTNSYDDLVVIDISNLNNVHEVSRIAGVFPEFRWGSPIAQPPGPGYYECPSFSQLVMGWKKDSIYAYCHK